MEAQLSATCPPSSCSLGAVSGILATLTFPPLHRALGLVATGGLSIWLQLACVAGATLPSVAAAAGAAVGTSARLYAVVWGLVLSRFGLWSFDLAVNQLIQESVGSSSLGAVSGVQGSMQSLCQVRRLGGHASGCACGGWWCWVAGALLGAPSVGIIPVHHELPSIALLVSCRRLPALQMLAYLAGVLVPATDSFVYLMAGSCCVVATSAAAFTAFALRTRCGGRLAMQLQVVQLDA